MNPDSLEVMSQATKRPPRFPAVLIGSDAERQMHFYPFNIGDYASHTKHLSLLEDIAYRRLIDLYYLNERPLNGCVADVARSIGMRDNIDSVEYVLREFFEVTDQGFTQKRIDKEIAHYQDKAQKASAAGKASAAKRSKPTPDEQTLNGRSTDDQPNSKHETVTSKQRKKKETASVSSGPIQQVISQYNEILPELPAARLVTAKRTDAVKAFIAWVITSTRSDGTRRADNEDEAVAWTLEYFKRARDNDFIMGRTPKSATHPNWRPDLEYVLSDKGKTQIIEKTLEAT